MKRVEKLSQDKAEEFAREVERAGFKMPDGWRTALKGAISWGYRQAIEDSAVLLAHAIVVRGLENEADRVTMVHQVERIRALADQEEPE